MGVKNDAKNLHFDILPSATRRAFLYCAGLPFLSQSQWYLAGGTALALQVGHRQSVDLDFFTPQEKFREEEIERKLLATHSWKTTLLREGTIYGTLMKAKMSFIAYPFFRPSKNKLRYGTVQILSPKDISAMKIVAVSQRGRKRDFVDLYWYCLHQEPLKDIIMRAVNQYPGQEDNLPYILKSLTYFEDAEKDPMPKLNFAADWKNIKAYFQKEAAKLTKELFHFS